MNDLSFLLMPRVLDGISGFKQSNQQMSMKARSIGYIWEMYQYLREVTFDYLIYRDDQISSAETNELRSDLTSQWKLDVLYGRRVANQTATEILIYLVANQNLTDIEEE